jgi:hypothetical protein
MTVREMLMKMDSYELSEWAAYFRIKDEPVPQDPEIAIANAKRLLPGG